MIRRSKQNKTQTVFQEGVCLTTVNLSKGPNQVNSDTRRNDGT